MDLSKYSYQDLTKLAKDYGINGNNMKREDLEKLIYTRIENDDRKDFTNPTQGEGATPTPNEEHNESSHGHKKPHHRHHEEKEETFETNSYVEFTVNGQKYSGTTFTFPSEIFADRKRIVEDNYGKEIFK